MANKLRQNYIIVSQKKTDSGEYTIEQFISCEQVAISRYVRELKFGSEIKMSFVPVKSFEHQLFMSPNHGDVRHIYMDETKSALDFRNQVDELLIELEIKIDEKETK